MNISLYLLDKFWEKQKFNIVLLCILSLILSFVYSNISSIINANIITSIQKHDFINTVLNYKYFIGISVLFVSVFYIYKIIQNGVLTFLSNWTKSELFELVLKSNNENMRNVNFIEFITPITRISNSCTMLLNDVITNIFPTLGFLVVILIYFLYKDLYLGLGFLIGNILIFLYLLYFWKDMFEYKQKQEKMAVDNERYILDVLNNIDKVIYRGEVNKETLLFGDKTDDCTNFTVGLMTYITNHVFIMNIATFVVLFGSLWYMIRLQRAKQLDNVTFITFLSILFMYRDNLLGTIQNIPYNIESAGRVDLIVREFNNMVGSEFEIKTDTDSYSKEELPFDKLTFENVSFKYDKTDTYVFENYNKEVILSDKIIGITGTSGKGKSSFVKLLMRLHEANSGNILIDGVNIKTIDPYYIRQNITYVNQNSRLFDRKVIENIYYGCKDKSKCEENLREVLSYPKIQELYKNVDIVNANAGPLGENLSGGQRQVINIISGLINPTKILILDEPTNALDRDLKMEVIKLLQNSKKYKKTVIIITHDRDVYNMFDETLEI